ncbi:putative AC9 transposase, partial [Bienertia sinuspersici]
YQHETEEVFNIIQWWKNHSSKFPVLARIAKDILTIPASTIASESAFSAGRKVLDEKRSRFSSVSIEMCLCKKDWDQAEKRTQGLKEEEEDEDDPWMTMDTSNSGGSGDGGNQQQAP